MEVPVQKLLLAWGKLCQIFTKVKREKENTQYISLTNIKYAWSNNFKEGNMYKFRNILLILVVVLITFLLNSCIISDYEDTVRIVPRDAQIIFNINLQSYFKRRAILNELDELNQDPSLKKFFTVVFSGNPSPEINLEEDLLPYVNTNFSLAYYNLGNSIGSFFNPTNIIKKQDINFVLIFDIQDKEDIDKFLHKLDTVYHPQKENYRGQDFFYYKDTYYFTYERFLVFSHEINLLKNSIDCTRNNNLSIIKEENFLSFREKKISSDSIGFIYYNIPGIGTEFLNKIPDKDKTELKDLLDCIKFMGTSIEVDRDKLKFNTYLVQAETLTPVGKEFFSLERGKLKSLEFFPEKSSLVIALSSPGKLLNTGVSLLESLGPKKIKTFTTLFKKGFGYTMGDILKRSQEMGVNFITGENNSHEEDDSYQEISQSSWILALKLDPKMPLMKETLQSTDTILSFLGRGEAYKEVSITSLPYGLSGYSILNDFLLLSLGNKENIKAVIDTFRDDEESIEKRINPQISTESVGLIYIKLDKLYNSSLSHLIKNEELREKLRETFENYPELWGNINNSEDGYISTLIMPF